VASLQELEKIFPTYAKTAGPNLIEVRVSRGARKDLGRPLNSPAQNLNELKDNIIGQS
jgi:phosphonopyruvate decarboxylase